MTRHLAKPCAYPGCAQVVRGQTYCAKHQAQRNADKVRVAIERDGREAEIRAFYMSERWRRLRKWVLSHDPLCRECGEIARVVDHIKPIKLGGARLDVTNLQPLCDGCHNRKRRREQHGR